MAEQTSPIFVQSGKSEFPSLDDLQRIPHTSSHGPATSQDAGDEHTDSGHRELNALRVLEMVHRWPGRTAAQLFARCLDVATDRRLGRGGEFALVRAYGLDKAAGYVRETVERASRLRQEIMRRLYDLDAIGLIERKATKGSRGLTATATTEGLLRLSLIRGGRKASTFRWAARRGE